MQTAPPLSHKPLHFLLPEVISATLGDGTPLYIVPAANKDIVTISIALRTGSVHDEVPGVTSIAAQMLNRGTTSMEASVFAEEIERRGCSLRTAADSDATTLHASGLAEWFDDLVGFAADALLHPRFDERELDTLRQRTIADMMVELVDVEWLAGRACASRTFYDHPYALPKNGTPTTLRELNRDLLIRAHERMLMAERYIIVAGPVDPDSVVKKLSAALSDLPAQQKTATLPVATSSFEWGVMAPKEDAVQSALRISLPSIGYNHADYATMQLVANVLGGYTLARLFTILREEKGYTYGAYAFPAVRPLSATTAIITSVGNEFTKDTLDTIAEQVERIKTERIGDEEFENARQQILGSFARNCETPQQAASLVYTIVQYHLPFDYFDRHIERLQQITPDSALSMQKQYYSASNWIVGISGVSSVIEQALAPHVQHMQTWHPEGYTS
ncbi:MAG: insulinase family protein [Ignavibacteria bacterium]|nr:insulinase family protein [Ignavibacteria bacterium]